MRKRTALVPLALATAAVGIGAATAPAANVHAAANCTLNDIRIFYLGQDGAAGTFGEKFRLNKRHSGSCSIRGYATVTLQGKKGHAIPITVHKDNSFKVRTRTLSSSKKVFFNVLHPDPGVVGSSKCKGRNVYRFKVVLPGSTKPLILKGFDPIKFCQKGARVTPFAKKQ